MRRKYVARTFGMPQEFFLDIARTGQVTDERKEAFLDWVRGLSLIDREVVRRMTEAAKAVRELRPGRLANNAENVGKMPRHRLEPLSHVELTPKKLKVPTAPLKERLSDRRKAALATVLSEVCFRTAGYYRCKTFLRQTHCLGFTDEAGLNLGTRWWSTVYNTGIWKHAPNREFILSANFTGDMSEDYALLFDLEVLVPRDSRLERYYRAREDTPAAAYERNFRREARIMAKLTNDKGKEFIGIAKSKHGAIKKARAQLNKALVARMEGQKNTVQGGFL